MKFIFDTADNPETTCVITYGDDIAIFEADGNVSAELDWSAISNQLEEDICKTLKNLQKLSTLLKIELNQT